MPSSSSGFAALVIFTKKTFYKDYNFNTNIFPGLKLFLLEIKVVGGLQHCLRYHALRLC